MKNCKHEDFQADVAVHRLQDSGRFQADIRIKCTQCNESFRFLGLPAGVDLNGACVSADGTEARMAIGTQETVANIIDGVCPVGFTVRKEGSEPGYAEIKAQIENAPMTWLPALLQSATMAAHVKRCFKVGCIAAFVGRIEKALDAGLLDACLIKAPESDDRNARLRESFELFEQALHVECTCYSDPDRGCKYCSLTTRAQKLMEETFGEP